MADKPAETAGSVETFPPKDRELDTLRFSNTILLELSASTNDAFAEVLESIPPNKSS